MQGNPLAEDFTAGSNDSNMDWETVPEDVNDADTFTHAVRDLLSKR